MFAAYDSMPLAVSDFIFSLEWNVDDENRCSLCRVAIARPQEKYRDEENDDDTCRCKYDNIIFFGMILKNWKFTGYVYNICPYGFATIHNHNDKVICPTWLKIDGTMNRSTYFRRS